MQSAVSVVHLIWMPYKIELFKGFVDSYYSFKAGYPHQLILLFNGIWDEKEADDYHQYIRKYGIEYETFYYKTGQDLEAYRWVASQLSSDYILFLNSYSRFLADNWLQKFTVGIKDNVRLIGATGSWQSYYSSIFEINNWKWAKGVTLKENVRKYKLLLKALFLWRWYFKSFPNPHIRTNAFLIHRQLFLQLQIKIRIKKKIDAYRLESGIHSITNQVMQKGFDVSLVDKNGITYDIKDWHASKIFWTADQDNLMIADNQTETYLNSDIQNKQLLERLAWGKK